VSGPPALPPQPPGPPEPSGLPERRDENLRIGNPERDAVVARLNHALAEGRLELGEYEERVGHVYAARTAGELVPITADLPAPLPPPAPKPKRTLALTRDERKWAGTSIVLTAIWLVQVVVAGDGFGYFWPIWPIAIWGAVLLSRRITG